MDSSEFLRNFSVKLLQQDSCPVLADKVVLRELASVLIAEKVVAITSSAGEFIRLVTPNCLTSFVARAAHLDVEVAEFLDTNQDAPLSHEATLHDAWQCFIRTQKHFLPIVAEKKFIGVASAQRLLDAVLAVLGETRASLQHTREELKSIDAYVSYIVHDIRGPLSVIITAANLLESAVKQNEGGEYYFNLIRDVASRTIRFAGSLLELNKQRAVGHKLNCQKIRIQDFLQKILEENAPLVQFRGLKLQTIGALCDGVVEIDVGLISHAVQNLIDNSCKYSKRNSNIFIGADLRDNGCGGQEFVLFVRDEGCGIDAQHRRTIFEPYVRISTAHGGVGFGLAIVKNFVNLHGGTVELESGENAGTTIILRLPATPPSAGTPVGQND